MDDLTKLSSDALVAELERRGILDPDHIVELQATGFGLQHPIRCRPNLLDCSVNRALNALDGPPMPLGRYRVDLVDGELTNWRAPNVYGAWSDYEVRVTRHQEQQR